MFLYLVSLSLSFLLESLMWVVVVVFVVVLCYNDERIGVLRLQLWNIDLSYSLWCSLRVAISVNYLLSRLSTIRCC